MYQHAEFPEVTAKEQTSFYMLKKYINIYTYGHDQEEKKNPQLLSS